jgi:hypothetical protein
MRALPSLERGINMISIDMTLKDIQKFISTIDVIMINDLLSDNNNILGESRMLLNGINNDCYIRLSIIGNDVDSADEIFFVKNPIEIDQFQTQMLKELNKLSMISGKRIKARIEDDDNV